MSSLSASRMSRENRSTCGSRTPGRDLGKVVVRDGAADDAAVCGVVPFEHCPLAEDRQREFRVILGTRVGEGAVTAVLFEAANVVQEDDRLDHAEGRRIETKCARRWREPRGTRAGCGFPSGACCAADRHRRSCTLPRTPRTMLRSAAYILHGDHLVPPPAH